MQLVYVLYIIWCDVRKIVILNFSPLLHMFGTNIKLEQSKFSSASELNRVVNTRETSGNTFHVSYYVILLVGQSSGPGLGRR